MPDATSRTTAAEPETPTKASATGLTLPQIMGGALAAATAAILGSFLGVIGTIGGAAAASVISTVGAALYQKSLERTRDAVKSRLVVNQVAGTKVAGAVARVTGQVGSPPVGARPAARPVPNGVRPGMPPRPGVPGPAAPMSPPYGAPVPPGVATRRLPDGTLVPAAPQQLRAGGRTVTTRFDAAGRPVGEPVDPTRRIPNARTPGGGNPTQVVPPMGPDGRPVAGPTRQMSMNGPFSPPGGQPTTHLAHGPGDDPTVLAPAAEDRTPWYRRFGWKTWVTLGGVTASVFAIGLLASFAVESATGHPLSGGTSGTSVGAIFGQNTEAPATTESSSTEEPGDTDATTSTSDQGSNNDEGTQAPSSTTRAPSTTTSRAQQQQPQSSLLPRFNEQGGSTGN